MKFEYHYWYFFYYEVIWNSNDHFDSIFNLLNLFIWFANDEQNLILSIIENYFVILNCLNQYPNHTHLHYPSCSIFFAFQLKYAPLLSKAAPHLFLMKGLRLVYIFLFIPAICLLLLFLYHFKELLSLTLLIAFCLHWERVILLKNLFILLFIQSFYLHFTHLFLFFHLIILILTVFLLFWILRLHSLFHHFYYLGMIF